MAKRKRLTPAQVDASAAAPEAKSALPKPGARPPIADVAHDAVTVNALYDLSEKISNARNEGRWIEKLRLDEIVADQLIRDRVEVDDDEMESLRQSLKFNGQQTAIEVMRLPEKGYGLISGWRRLMALRTLEKEGGIDTIKAIVRQPEDTPAAYRAMVDENEIRVGLSFYERGRIVAMAVVNDIYPSDKIALQELFSTVPRAKRSKIGSFVRVVRALDDKLAFPAALSERAGLALSQAIDADPKLAVRIKRSLTASAPQTAAKEQAILAKHMAKPKAPKSKPVALGNGLEYSMSVDGKLTLQGRALADLDFKARIIAALKSVS